VAERELGRVEVDLYAMLLRVDVALARAVVERGRDLRGADAGDGRAVEGEEGERARGAVGLGLELQRRGQSVVRLPREVERLTVAKSSIFLMNTVVLTALDMSLPAACSTAVRLRKT